MIVGRANHFPVNLKGFGSGHFCYTSSHLMFARPKPKTLATNLPPGHGQLREEIPEEGTVCVLYSADREEIWRNTGCSAAVRKRDSGGNKKWLTVVGPREHLETARDQAWEHVWRNEGPARAAPEWHPIPDRNIDKWAARATRARSKSQAWVPPASHETLQYFR